MGILGGIQRIRHDFRKRTLQSKERVKTEAYEGANGRLNLNSGSSTTEEHHQTGHLPLPREGKNSKCHRSLEQGEILVFLDGQKKTQRWNSWRWGWESMT